MEAGDILINYMDGYVSPYKTVSLFEAIYGDINNKIFMILLAAPYQLL